MRPRRPLSVLRTFLSSEAGGGIVLIGATALAMIVANSGWSDLYRHVLAAHVGPLSVLHWINDAGMAGFFLLVGLEIKRELVDGQLAQPADRRLPVVAAAAGMAVPALLYLAVTRGEPGLARGWAIPAATDIAFALGVLALLGKRVPASLKLLLATVAVIDDMGAVAIIALFYTPSLSVPMLAAAAAILLVMAWLARREVRALWPFLLLAGALWVATYLSGVHATVAGVLAALTVPIARAARGVVDEDVSPLHRLEHALQPWVAYAIVPVFAFANAGVDLRGLPAGAMTGPLVLGIAAGLFLGKQAGVFAGIRLAVATGLAPRPSRATWMQIYGVAVVCGIGLTMALFIGGLAFGDAATDASVKIGVLGASLASALWGAAVLWFAGARPH